MAFTFRIELNAQPDQLERLQKLQVAFAAMCNELTPYVSEHRCWNRVTLHHLKYREMRENYPDMGSQMVCNAIYAVSKVSRLVYQHPDSPYLVKKQGSKTLPVIHFSDDCPVYFDSHTLTLMDRQLSMYTMDGRIKFELMLTADQKTLLSTQKLVEITLSRSIEGGFVLSFFFGEDKSRSNDTVAMNSPVTESRKNQPPLILPSYVGVEVAS